MCFFNRAAVIELIPAGVTGPFEFKAFRGQYVKNVLPGHGKYLTLCEAQVFAGKGKREKKIGNKYSSSYL